MIDQYQDHKWKIRLKIHLKNVQIYWKIFRCLIFFQHLFMHLFVDWKQDIDCIDIITLYCANNKTDARRKPIKLRVQDKEEGE